MGQVSRQTPTSRGRLGGAIILLAVMGTAGQAQNLVTLQGIKSATVAPGGLAFASLGLSSRRAQLGSFFDDPDGSMVLGYGFGSAQDSVGVQVTANITSLTDAFGDSGNLAIKFSRHVGTPDLPLFAALSFDRLAPWGDGKLADPSTTFSLTAFPRVPIGAQSVPMMVTVGYGSNVTDRRREPGAFVGIGMGISENLGASLAWTGESITLGTAFKFDGLDNLRFSASLDDVFDQVDGQRLTLSATYYFNDLFGG